MLRYYMTPETRAALIAESNRMIAARAAMKTLGKHGENPHSGFGATSQWSVWGSMPYAAQGSGTSLKYEGLMRLVAPTDR